MDGTEMRTHYKPPRSPRLSRVLTADAGIQSQKLRLAIRRAGAVDNIQLRSSKDDSQALVQRDRETLIPIDGYDNWQANALRELYCRCGEGVTYRRISNNMRRVTKCVRERGGLHLIGRRSNSIPEVSRQPHKKIVWRWPDLRTIFAAVEQIGSRVYKGVFERHGKRSYRASI
jgi:hypothetical protein